MWGLNAPMPDVAHKFHPVSRPYRNRVKGGREENVKKGLSVRISPNTKLKLNKSSNFRT